MTVFKTKKTIYIFPFIFSFFLSNETSRRQKITESEPILANSQSNSHVLDQHYSPSWPKSVNQKPLWNIPHWWSMQNSYEMHISALVEYSALAKTCAFLSETWKLLLEDTNIWQKLGQIYFFPFRPYFCLIRALLTRKS